MSGPSREFKENFIVGGCLTISLVVFILAMAYARLWWFLSLAVVFFLFIAFQGVIFNLFKRK